MLEVGEKRVGTQLGKTGYNAKRYYVYLFCSRCGEYRWARCRNDRIGKFCRSCSAGRKSGVSRCLTSKGYVKVLLSKNSPFYFMANKDGRIFEHRLVMAQHLGRNLLNEEIVHHKNGIKDDNRTENLRLLPSVIDHMEFVPCRNCDLRKEIRLLRWQIKQLTKTRIV